MVSYSFFLFHLLFFLIFSLLMVLAVAYFTLMERKVMSSVQLRNGPDYVGFFGILQPISDALKLLLKEFLFVKNSFSIIFIAAPSLIFALGLLSWAFIPMSNFGSFFETNFSIFWFMVISSVDVFILFMSGFSSGNRYAFLGSLRSVVQMLSYEIAFSILLMPVILISGSASFSQIVFVQDYSGISNFFWFFPSSFLVFICILAETNRAPFDLPEAEAELVAGYNVEYSAIPFAYFFLGEYLNILTGSAVFVILFWSGWSTIHFFLKVFIINFVIVWVRATLPRSRYDLLMAFSWKIALPVSLSLLFYYVFLYFFFFLNFINV